MTSTEKHALRLLLEAGGTEETVLKIGRPTRCRFVLQGYATWVTGLAPKYYWDNARLELTEKGQELAVSLIKVTKHQPIVEDM